MRFNYGATVPWVNRLDDGSINAIAGPERLLLRTPVALYGQDLRTVGEFVVEAGQAAEFDTMTPHWVAGVGRAVDVLSIFDRHGEHAHLRAETR